VIALRIMIYSPLYPFIILTNFITRRMRIGKNVKTGISATEFRAITDSVIEEGVMEDEESRILQNLMKFKNILVKSIMTPQVVIQSAEENTSIQDFYDAMPNPRFSRIPVFQGDLNQFTGFVLKDEVMERIIKTGGGTLEIHSTAHHPGQ
jgi:CBS domain containing-hemolysin-like protein